MTVAGERARKRQHREQTRQEILAAGQAFLRERSFREMSVDALMAGAGHSRTVFYRHFDDLPALVLAILGEVSTELRAIAESWARVDGAGPELARERLGLLVEFHHRNGPLVRAMVEASHHDDTIEEALTGLSEGFVALTTHAIQTRVARGQVAELDAPEIARALVRMLEGYLIDAMAREPQIAPERVLDVVWTIWTRTLFPGETA